MNQEEQEEYLVNTQIHGQIGQAAQATAAAQYYVQEQEKSIADAQLECERILEKCRHMLKQDLKKYKEDGTFDWVEIEEKHRMLTELGVNRIMQTMEAYVNKESLLSNYDDKIINRRMLEFCLALNGNIFMKYELYFRNPAVEEIIDEIKERKVNEGKMSAYGLYPSNPEIQIENEIDFFMKLKRRQNQAEYELLFTELKAIVESVHQRAWRGEERGSLRRHTNISEIIGGSPSKAKDQGGVFGWMKR